MKEWECNEVTILAHLIAQANIRNYWLLELERILKIKKPVQK